MGKKREVKMGYAGVTQREVQRNGDEEARGKGTAKGGLES